MRPILGGQGATWTTWTYPLNTYGSAPDAGPGGDTGQPSEAGDAEAEASKPLAPIGGACWTDSDCAGGATCWKPSDGFPAGYCVIEGCKSGQCPAGSVCASFQDGVSRCVDDCKTDGDCRVADGYVCDKSVCWPGDGKIPPGGSCGFDDQCQGGTNAICIQQSGFIGGYCIIADCSNNCPAGSKCAEVLTNNTTACIPGCKTSADCRPGYACVANPQSKWDGACFPSCQTDADCPGDFGCREDPNFKKLMCEDVSQECSPKNTKGDCPKGQVCDKGVCKAFGCNDTVMEPNESMSAAKPMPAASTDGLQICKNDHDWFQVSADKPATVTMVGIDSNYTSGDLDVDWVDAQQKVLWDATNGPFQYNADSVIGPSNLQLVSMIGAAGNPATWLHVYGVSGAVNNYGLVVRQIDWKDGVCQDLFSIEECRAQNAMHVDDPSKLVIFPASSAQDPYIGDGVFFKNGLSAFGNPEHTSSARLWGRREVVMILRKAIHDVQQAFPGTKPFGIGDISIQNGSTPDGHPNHTHDYGGNVDIAYFVQDKYQGTAGNLPYRQICCDAPLDDWHCVDTNTSSAGYGVCVAGSETTHIVDLPRTAMLVAKIAGSGRLRVIGVEAKVKPGLVKALDDLVAASTITLYERNLAAGSMASKDDHASWLWHFNHMHASFCPNDCSFGTSATTSFQGPWTQGAPEAQARMAREFYVRRAQGKP
jgi:hypothetical protein